MTKETVKDYNVRTGGYGEHIQTYRDSSLAQKTIKLFNIPPGGFKLLDLCCGQGDASKALTDSGTQTYYFDITRKMVDQGIIRKQINPARIKVGDMNGKLPYDDAEFDGVLIRYALHDAQNKDSLFGEVRRILKSGGIFQVIDMYGISTETLALYNQYHKRKTLGEGRPCQIITEGELEKLFLENSFSNIARDYYLSKVETSQWLKEGQITEERLVELNQMFIYASENPELKRFFGIRQANPLVLVDFPVILMSGQK